MDDFENWEDSEETPQQEIPLPPPRILAPSASRLPISQDSGGGDSIWLTSYADLMTLIACFFILMVAFANFDPASFSRKATEMAKHFSGDKPNETSDELTKILEELANDPILKEKAQLKMEMDGLVIKFSGSALFEPGKADIRPEIQDTLDIMIDVIKEKSPKSRILVEGHTDDFPLMNSSKYRNNWELSGARASRVVERFEQFDLEPKNMVSVGYGSTRPVKPNYNENGSPNFENMQENRRIVIKVLPNPKLMKREKMGLGVYFDDNKLLDSSSNKIAP